jgi:hypothetical protein
MRLFNKLLVIMAVVCASACSSGSSKSPAPTTTAPPVTKASYLIQANTICTTMKQRIAALGNPRNDPIDIAANFDQVHVIIDEALAQLRLVAVPPADVARIAAVYATVDKLQKDSPAYSAALRAGNQQAATAARKQVATDQARANAAAVGYGMTACRT